jgi:alpha-L-rhamnosidase
MISRQRKTVSTLNFGSRSHSVRTTVKRRTNPNSDMPATDYATVLMPFILFLACVTNANALQADSLRAENQHNPIGLDTARPRLSWHLESSRRGERQTAYQILAASSAEKLAHNEPDLWDSGKVESAESIQIPYSGRALGSTEQGFWKVRVWDLAAKPSRYSKPASFEIGLLSASDWKASWITRTNVSSEVDFFKDNPAPLLRKEFTAAKTRIKRARIYASGLGYYELRLNGKTVGDHVLNPGWTDYSKRVLCSAYDVTDQIKSGRNAFGVMLGNGWFNPLPLKMWGKLNLREHLTVGEPCAIVQLVVEYSDGSSQTVVTDGTWKSANGPISRNSVYLGETYDARREIAGWDTPNFDDSAWQTVSSAHEPKIGELHAQDAPPIRVTRTLRPLKLTESKPGVYVFDFGQNFAGWARLRTKGPAGTRIKLRYGELLYPDGTLNGMTSVAGQIKGGGKDYRYDGEGVPKTAFQQDEYILKGQGEETFCPRFAFHGFRYVEITGLVEKPNLQTLEGLRLNSDVSMVGSFECSNPLFNRIQEMVLWTELSNLFSVQSDCPHREKFGYGGDIVASSEMAMLNFDMANFYAKVARDFGDAIRTNGGFTETAPYVGISDEGLGDQSGPIGWGTAQPLLLWQLYQYYGDRRGIEENYEATRRWIALLKSKAKDGILDNGISDHESLAPKPRALTGTAFYYFNLKLFQRLAEIMHRDTDAFEARDTAERVKAAFNAKFYHSETGKYDTGSQACQAFALNLKLAPESEIPKALAALTHDIEQHDGHLTTGIFGTKYMLQALTHLDRAGLAFRIVDQRTFPGWGYMLEKGATTLWEHWEFSDNMYSHNHPMFGSVSEWFYKAIGGIQAAPDAVGFDKVIIRPQPVGDLKWAKASYNSVRGLIASEWKCDARKFELMVQIPIGATATIYLPGENLTRVEESGKSLEQVKEVESEAFENKTLKIRVGSGKYRFASTLSH